jgi:hypothetical protein
MAFYLPPKRNSAIFNAADFELSNEDVIISNHNSNF